MTDELFVVELRELPLAVLARAQAPTDDMAILVLRRRPEGGQSIC